jgi:aspartyl-tRNA(Asn)/glutamyl-tRNA(Gln) amidotransferase subunit A
MKYWAPAHLETAWQCGMRRVKKVDDLSFYSLGRVRDLLRNREISARQLVDAQLARLEALEPRLNAFITVTAEEARRDADAADEEAARGELRGPLHGVPLTVKDLLWTRGTRTTSGSKIFSDFVPEEDATAVSRLREAGGLFLGKTNLHEFAYGISNVNPHYGPVRNPWDNERISGGSSGGSAASLAAGIGYGSVGTDTGGSIRIPSALCGTVGLKPTYGRVSRHGVTPLAWSLDHVGPIARTVEDVAILFDVLAGFDPRDPSSSRRKVEPVTPALEQLPSGIRIGIYSEYFYDNVDTEVRALVERAVGDFEKLGLERVQISIPELEHQGTCRNVITFAEAASYHETWLRERPADYGAATRELLQLGLLVSATEYLAAQRARRRVLGAVCDTFRNVDMLVSPTVPVPAPNIGEEQLSNGEKLRPGLLRLVSPYNTVGYPAISLPCGFTRAGLPVGLQLAARPFEEALLLQAAHAYETSHPWLGRHPTGSTNG